MKGSPILSPSLSEKGIYISYFTRNNYLNLKLLVWFILMYFPIFLNLGGLVMQRWDEARYAVSSYEMLHGGNPFYVTYLNEPSMGSAKPPLLHWVQAFSILLFGFSEMSVRLPSAIAGMLLCILIMHICLKKFNSFSLGFIITVFLVSVGDSVCGMDHSFRTADYDAFLMFFSMCAAYNFFRYNEDPLQKKYIVRFFTFVTLAVLTKAVAGLFFAPGFLVYLLLKNNLIKTLKNKWFWLSVGGFIFIIAFMFITREILTPGYLEALNDNELFGRHNTIMDGHVGPFTYYFDDIYRRYGLAFYLVILGWIFGISSKDNIIRSASIYTFVLAATFFLVISSAQSKLHWYSFPLYPLLAFQAGLFIWIMLKKLGSWLAAINMVNTTSFVYFSIFFILCAPYYIAVKNADHRDFTFDQEMYDNAERYFKQARPVMKDGIMIAHPGDFQLQYRFYYHKLNDRGFNLKYEVGYQPHYQPGDVLIVEAPEYQDQIKAAYNVAEIDYYAHLRVFKVLGKKQETPVTP